jgi:hypothetical protein
LLRKALDRRKPLTGSLVAKSCQFAQRRDLIDAVRCRRSEKHQIIAGIPALTGKGACPPLGFAIRIRIQGLETITHLSGGCSQPVQAVPRSGERSWRRIIYGIEVLPELSQSDMSASFRSHCGRRVHQNP